MGAGAVGSFLGACLAAGGWDVTLVGRSAIDAGPLRLDVVAPGGAVTSVDLRHASWATVEPEAPDLLLFAVKMYQLGDALDAAGRWPLVPVCTVENGIGAERQAESRRPGCAVIAGSLTTAVERDGPRVRRLNRGGLGLASVAGASDELAGELAAALERGGLRVRRYADAAAMKWSKLVGNLVANATSALLDWEPGRVYGDPAAFALDRAQLREAFRVMRALGLRPVGLPGTPVPLLARAVDLPPALSRRALAGVVRGARGGKPPSLQLHLRGGGGPSEAAWLNGAVVRAGAEHGVPTPVNRALARLLEEASSDPQRRQWFVGHPERLGQAVDERVAPTGP